MFSLVSSHFIISSYFLSFFFYSSFTLHFSLFESNKLFETLARESNNAGFKARLTKPNLSKLQFQPELERKNVIAHFLPSSESLKTFFVKAKHAAEERSVSFFFSDRPVIEKLSPSSFPVKVARVDKNSLT